MICPICKSKDARRSRRQFTADFMLSVFGVYPWRCNDCHARFHARLMPLSESLRAHCPICGNQEVKRIAPEHVTTAMSFMWRFLHIPAYRCVPCRYKYFSVRPRRHVRRELEQLSSSAD